MAIPRALSLLVGALALLTTSTIVVIHIVLTSYIPEPLAVQRAAIVSSILEGIALFVLSWLYSTYFLHATPQYPKRFPGLAFGCSILVCALATVSAVVTLIILGRVTADTKATFRISTQRGFLIGSSVALGLSFASQLVFIVVHFVFARINGHSVSSSAHSSEEDQTVQVHVKSIPYSRTSPAAVKMGSGSGDRSRPQSSGGRSVSDTMGSIRTSISSVVRPLSSRRLLAREKRSGSLDSMAYQDRKFSVEDGFDSWDTSSVDPQNRQTVMQSASPTPARLLETIPASPTTSRSPSPGYTLDLEPPPSRARTRSRSFSPAGSRISRDLPPPPPNSEAHIHPLFRSESPTPPAILTPGTVVMAAPNAGQTISDRHSIRSLSRMRSGSLPAPSPLSRQGSFDDFVPLRPGTRDTPEASIHEALLEQEEEEEAAKEVGRDVKSRGSKRVGDGEGPERRMTPPIPEWILSADGRNSMSDYNRRTRGYSEAGSLA